MLYNFLMEQISSRNWTRTWIWSRWWLTDLVTYSIIETKTVGILEQRPPSTVLFWNTADRSPLKIVWDFRWSVSGLGWRRLWPRYSLFAAAEYVDPDSPPCAHAACNSNAILPFEEVVLEGLDTAFGIALQVIRRDHFLHVHHPIDAELDEGVVRASNGVATNGKALGIVSRTERDAWKRREGFLFDWLEAGTGEIQLRNGRAHFGGGGSCNEN